jgi:hypothetical protein
MQRWEAQAKAEAEAERQQRAAAAAERQRTGPPRRGKAPQPVAETPEDKAQRNCTAPERHIMQTNNTGWEDCGNAQASVDGTCQIILACDVTVATNDKQQAVPVAQATLTTLAQAGIELPQDEAGKVYAMPATRDNGDYSEAAAQHWRSEALIPTGPRGASSTMPLKLRRVMRLPRRRSGWLRKCGRLKARPYTPDARSSWNRYVVRSKKRGGSVASCCVVWRSSVAHGVWYA